MTPGEREAHRLRQSVLRLLNHPRIRNLRNVGLEHAATILDTTPGRLEAAIEAGLLNAERVGPDGAFVFSRGDLMDFLGSPRPIVHLVRPDPQTAGSQPPLRRRRKPTT